MMKNRETTMKNYEKLIKKIMKMMKNRESKRKHDEK
jgi:hypothetical protein